MKNSKPLFTVGIVLILSCGNPSPISAPLKFTSDLDGNRPIQIVVDADFTEWARTTGFPIGIRTEWFAEIIPIVNTKWNPFASGPVQTIHLHIDNNTTFLDANGIGPCKKNGFTSWSIPGKSDIWICPDTKVCSDDLDPKTINGKKGCLIMLLHELGHCLGARGHVMQNGRDLHQSGPIICNWSFDCSSPSLTDYTDEDVALICEDGGHGGRCI
jgi:hypothetical protein